MEPAIINALFFVSILLDWDNRSKSLENIIFSVVGVVFLGQSPCGTLENRSSDNLGNFPGKSSRGTSNLIKSRCFHWSFGNFKKSFSVEHIKTAACLSSKIT